MDLGHGETSCILLPVVCKYDANVTEEKQTRATCSSIGDAQDAQGEGHRWGQGARAGSDEPEGHMTCEEFGSADKGGAGVAGFEHGERIRYFGTPRFVAFYII